MKNFGYYILAFITVMMFVGCADEQSAQPEQDIDFCVRAAWQSGLARGTRALSATDIFADGGSDIIIAPEDYPETIDITCEKGETTVKAFKLTKVHGGSFGAIPCSEHSGYYNYTANFLFRDQLIRRENYTFHATAVIDDDGDPATTDDGDRLVGTATKENISGKHMLLTLHHTKALLRFAFKVDSDYDKIRFIKVTKINLNNADCTLTDKVLTTADKVIAYAYVDPSVVTAGYENTLLCTYDIYDKDTDTDLLDKKADDLTTSEREVLDAHRTRGSVIARNTFRLNNLKDALGVKVSTIKAGYYYDLHVTLNPYYLYVLSEHDNKHMTIE